MREPSNGKWTERALAELALYYLHDQLPPRMQAAFEQRLGEEQAARDALGQAVQLSWGSAGEPLRPSVAYRQQVHARLRRGTPSVDLPRRAWSSPRSVFLGSLAALLLVLLGVRLFSSSWRDADRREAALPSTPVPHVQKLQPPSRLAGACPRMKHRASRAACLHSGLLRRNEGGLHEREDQEDG